MNNVPGELFEEMVQGDDSSKVTKLAEIGKKSRAVRLTEARLSKRQHNTPLQNCEHSISQALVRPSLRELFEACNYAVAQLGGRAKPAMTLKELQIIQ